MTILSEMPPVTIRHAAARAVLAALLVLTPLAARADAGASQAAFGKALAHFQAGDLRDARIELLNALKENPENGVARLLFARVQLARGNGVAAQTEIERAVKSGIPREKTYHLTAHALLLQGKLTQALDAARNPAIPSTFSSYAARMRGRALLALGRAPEGGRELQTAVGLAPGNADAFVDLARYQAGTRDVNGAMRSADRALALAPGNVDALLLRGNIARATQGLPAALPWFDRAIKTDANSIEALLERAATLSDLKRYDPARADLKRVTGLIPNHPIAMYLSSVIAAREGKIEEAQQLLAQTKGALDKYPPAQLLRADLAIKQNNLGLAYENLSAVVAAAPNALAPRRQLAQVQLRRGDARGALQTLQPLAALPDLDPVTLAMLGSANAQSGEFAVAQGFYERALKLAPNLPGVATQLAMTRMAQGDAQGATARLADVLKADPKSLQALMSLTYVDLRARDYRGALGTADRLVATYPNLPIGYNLRGTAALGLNDVKRAEGDFRAAVAKDPKFLDARRNLAQLLVLTKREDAGKKELQAIVASNPGDTRTLMLLADIAGRANALPERVDWLRRAVLANPKDPAARAALIQTYIAQRQPGQALTEASALARDLPTNPAVLQLLAGVQIANRQAPAAVATVRRIVDLQPKSVPARILLARAQAATGPVGLADARATLQEAVRLGGPQADAAQISLIELELAARNPDAALAAAERLKGSTSQKAAADKLIGDVNMAAGRAPAALAAYQRVRAKVDNGQTNALVARAQLAAGQTDAAFATLQQYRARNPKDLVGAVALADVYIARKNWRAAVDTYLSVRNTPAAGSPEVLNNLAFAYGELGDPRAIAAAARANQLAPGQPTIEDTYGWVLVKSGRDLKRGLALLQSASKALPADPNIRYHLGVAYKANNMRTEAQRELRAALAAAGRGLEDPVAVRTTLAQVGG